MTLRNKLPGDQLWKILPLPNQRPTILEENQSRQGTMQFSNKQHLKDFDQIDSRPTLNCLTSQPPTVPGPS